MERVFISQPMNGLSADEIIARRNEIAAKLPDCEIIDSFINDGLILNHRRAFEKLVKSISLMSDATLCYFARGWENARGCKIEHAIAEAYEIPIMEEE